MYTHHQRHSVRQGRLTALPTFRSLARWNSARVAAQPQPAIILVEPIMGENIGAAARAMKNFGLSDLRLVAPKDGWPNQQADACASNAQDVVRAARVFETVEEALSDLTYVYAATARTRYMNKDYVLSRHLHRDLPRQGRIGIMFGQEKSGLRNQDVARADKIVTIDANPEYPVLNLAQAVVIVVYSLYSGHAEAAAAASSQADGPSATAPSCSSPLPGQDGPRFASEAQVSSTAEPWGQGRGGAASDKLPAFGAETASTSREECSGRNGAGPPLVLRSDLLNEQDLCTKGEVERFLSALELQLDRAAFFESDDKKRASVSINLRNIFTRIPNLSKREVSMLRGVLTKLSLAEERKT